LTADISLAAPTNYEISSDNSTFSSSLTLTQSSGTVAATTVYARLKSGLSVASYNSETVSITSTGATSSSVSLSGSVAAPTPTLSVTPSSLTGFTYIAGNGPSSSQTFSVSGADLTADISLTAPTNYEISSDNTTFGSSLSLAQSGGTVAATTVYARLKSGLSAANYNSETVSIASTGATTSTVSLSGSVAAPTITVTPTSLTGFNYASGSGPSSSQTFSVSGTNLTANISLTAPTNYEISSDNTTFSSSLTLTQSGNAVAATTIYARLKSGLSIASYNSETVSLTSTGATNSTVSLSGSVSSTSTIASGEIALRTQFVAPCGNDGRNEFIIITTAKAFDVNKLAFGSDGVGDTNFNFWWAGKDAATPTGYTLASAVTSFEIADPTAVTSGGDYDASGNKTSERTAYLNSVAGCTVFQDVPSDGIIPANSDFVIFLGGAGDGVASGTLTTDGFHDASTNMNFSTHCASGSAVQQYYAVYGKSNNTTGYFSNTASRVSTIWYQNGSSASAAGMSKINEVTYDPTGASGTNFAILTDGTILSNLGGTGGACIPVPSLILLPIELLYFNVSKNDSKVLLNWATATEKNNSHFIVERSADGVHFSEIGVVAGNGTTYSTQNYQFTDSQKSLSVNTYYRLKQVDFDGTTSYSSIKVVKNVTNKSPQIDILGNPVSSSINFNLYNFSSEANVKLINLMGQQVIEYQANPAQTTHTLNIASLPKGYYTLVISGSDLEATKVEKIIVQN
jgi:predicted secreted hydrolase